MTTHPHDIDVAELVATYIPELPADRVGHITDLVSQTLGSAAPTESAPLIWPGEFAGHDPEFESLLRDMAEVNLAGTRLALLASPIVADPDRVLASIVQSLAEGLARTLLRTFVAVLHADEKPWRDPAASAEANFDAYVQFLRSPAGQETFAQLHPKAVAQAGRLVRRYAELVEELVDRTSAALPQLVALPWGPAPGSGLVEVSLDAGDTHDDGHTVAILTFGDGRRVVLKPRDTRIEAAYNNLICWCNGEGITELPWVGQLVRDHHGFSEFITAPAAPDRDEKFYVQIGQLLAIHHLLGGNDVHSRTSSSIRATGPSSSMPKRFWHHAARRRCPPSTTTSVRRPARPSPPPFSVWGSSRPDWCPPIPTSQPSTSAQSAIALGNSPRSVCSLP